MTKQLRKTKFQADLPPAENRAVRMLKEELQLASNTDFLLDAVALFRWAVAERKQGHRILSESANGERRVLVFPRLERVAPDLILPRVEIKWTEQELNSLAKLVSEPEAAPPTEAWCGPYGTEWRSSFAGSKSAMTWRTSTAETGLSIFI